MLGTQGWQKILDEQVTDEAEQIQESAGSQNPLNAIDGFVECFRLPLEGAATEASEIRGEFEACMLPSSSSYLPWSISQCGGSYFMHQILPSGQMF